MNRRTRWCKKGCGKKVLFIGRNINKVSEYECWECKRIYTKEEL